MNIKKVFSLEERIVNMCMAKSDFVDDLGLFNGKMGLVIFFAHYHKFSTNRLYEDVADELMEKIITALPANMSIGLSTGLSGIGWGIEYLLQQEFMQGNSFIICADIDRKIMEIDPRRLTDMSLENGFEGLLHYILAHLSNAYGNKNQKPFDSIYLFDLYNISKNVIKMDKINNGLKIIASNYIQCFETEKWNYKFSLSFLLNQNEINKYNLSPNLIGLKNGYAGYLLRKILE